VPGLQRAVDRLQAKRSLQKLRNAKTKTNEKVPVNDALPLKTTRGDALLIISYSSVFTAVVILRLHLTSYFGRMKIANFSRLATSFRFEANRCNWKRRRHEDDRGSKTASRSSTF